MVGLQFTNITIESLFYERVWWGGAEPIHVTAMPRSVNTEVRSPVIPALQRPPAYRPVPLLKRRAGSAKHCGAAHARTARAPWAVVVEGPMR